ncbi:hypothetical protein DCO56_18550 [Sphingobacterium athyrii]|uniref:Uncharacterized protein n=1 Tax=Sphingobacterium athyrii TaxID=2152717 RepID=A0A363NQ82_9SPHI|nr:hypothetical protein DCO56_18550 [Sphingobacterium athyrii]
MQYDRKCNHKSNNIAFLQINPIPPVLLEMPDIITKKADNSSVIRHSTEYRCSHNMHLYF